MRKILYLDLDGVLVNLHDKFHDYYPDKLDTEDWFSYEKRKNIYIFDEIYAQTDPELFWASLSPYDGYLEFVNKCVDMYGADNVAILSALTQKDKIGCGKGKYKYCRNYLSMITDVLLVEHPSHKKLHAKPGCTLVDDTTNNIYDWVSAGGHGIVHKNYETTLKYIEDIYYERSC